MAKVKIKLNDKGIREYLKSPSVTSTVLAHAQRIAGRAGAGYKADVQVGRTRAQARVEAVTDDAKLDNLENNTLLKVIGGG